MYFKLPAKQFFFSDRAKKIFFALFISLLMSLTADSSRAGQSIITVNYPSDNTVREYDLMGISVSLPEGSADQIKAVVNGEVALVIVSDRKFRCFSVNLKLGVNTVEILAFKGDSVVDSVTRTVFRRSDLLDKYRKIPEEFKRDYFHIKDNSECTKCHVLDPTEYDKTPVSPATFDAGKYDIKTIISSTSTCYSCHNAIASYPYVHGPVSIWSCLSCHDPESSPRYSVLKPDMEICYTCHVEQQSEWLSKKHLHGPVTIGKCTICHSPHSSDNEFNLFMPVWDLCTNCHFEKGTGMHVFGDSMFKDGHPTKGREDPLREGKEFSCASCHNPHASNIPHLWIYEVDSLFELCQKCHNK